MPSIHCRYCNAQVEMDGKRLPPHNAGNIPSGRICDGVGRFAHVYGARRAPGPATSSRTVRESDDLDLTIYPLGLSEHEYIQLEAKLRRLYDGGLYDVDIVRELQSEFSAIDATWVGRWRKRHGLARRYHPERAHVGRGQKKKEKSEPSPREPKMIWDEGYNPGPGWDDDREEKVVPREDDYEYGETSNDDE
jgi:hypothetical protein